MCVCVCVCVWMRGETRPDSSAATGRPFPPVGPPRSPAAFLAGESAPPAGPGQNARLGLANRDSDSPGPTRALAARSPCTRQGGAGVGCVAGVCGGQVCVGPGGGSLGDWVSQAEGNGASAMRGLGRCRQRRIRVTAGASVASGVRILLRHSPFGAPVMRGSMGKTGGRPTVGGPCPRRGGRGRLRAGSSWSRRLRSALARIDLVTADRGDRGDGGQPRSRCARLGDGGQLL